MRCYRSACLALTLLLASSVGCVRLAPPISNVIFPTDLGGSFTITLPGHIPQETVADPISELDEFVLAEMEKQRIVGMGLGVIRGGRMFYLKGYGWQDREFQVPVRSRVTRFRWASLSKMLTAVAAFQLACPEGPVFGTPETTPSQCLDLDADIRTYLADSTPFELPWTYFAPDSGFGFALGPDSCPNWIQLPLALEERSITLAQLLSHRGGIQGYPGAKLDDCSIPTESPVPPEPSIDFTKALAYFSGNPFVVKPGTRYFYSTFGFSLAGQVIEDFAGRHYEDQIDDRVARPLELATLKPDEPGLGNRAVGYRIIVGTRSSDEERDQGTFVLPPLIEVARDGDRPIRYKLPGGGFSSTVEDLTRFCQGLIDERLLSEARREAMWSVPEGATDRTDARFGFFVGFPSGRRQVSHSGEQQKATTRLQMFPDEGLCVAVMTNTRGAGINLSELTDGVVDIVRSLPVTDLTLSFE